MPDEAKKELLEQFVKNAEAAGATVECCGMAGSYGYKKKKTMLGAK